jgi:hypothetical protein
MFTFYIADGGAEHFGLTSILRIEPTPNLLVNAIVICCHAQVFNFAATLSKEVYKLMW